MCECESENKKSEILAPAPTTDEAVLVRVNDSCYFGCTISAPLKLHEAGLELFLQHA
jgi:hypothetical protein